MPDTTKTIFPRTSSEIFSAWDNNPDAVVFSSGAAFLQSQRTLAFKLPQVIISLDKMEEMHRIDRTERYLEIGAMASLARVLRLGKIVPTVLQEIIYKLANPNLRNLLSIGSVIWQNSNVNVISSAMIALGARYEIRTQGQSRWITALEFSQENKEIFYNHELLYRIRIPLEQWDYQIFRILKSPENAVQDWEKQGGIVVFLAGIQNDILSAISIVFSGCMIITEKDIESKLLGKKLPLNISEAKNFVELWKNYLETLDDRSVFVCDRLINFIESAIMHFVD
ncbi:MAG: FAD binding domain-containing protein [Spirochaetaceae bacterium]|jgi:CO/xanthine dehydrogenase FAD-binding subunit|nr:FAD binding domain-containing protein [Spirochaetaceae bacterium]